MTDDKICPLSKLWCEKEKCAWWIKKNKDCAIPDLAKSIEWLAVKE